MASQLRVVEREDDDDNGDHVQQQQVDHHHQDVVDDTDEDSVNGGGIPLSNRSRMELFEDERDWAEFIKLKIEEDKELDNLKDYQYCQLALMEGEESIDGILERVQQLQQFKQEYNIQDTYQEGIRYLRDLVELWPSHFLNVEINTETGIMTLVNNLKGVDGSVLQHSTKNVTTWIVGTYYQFQALTCDLYSHRSGITSVVELSGFDWKRHLSYKLIQRFQEELGCCYPIRFQKTIPHNVGLFGNLILSAFRKLTPDKLDKVKILQGYNHNHNKDISLSELYLQPTPEDAKERIIQQFDHLLKIRYQNEKEFSL